MNNPNPFVPKGSLLAQQSQRRSRLKLTVFCILAVSVSSLVVMLIQGCKRENPDTQGQPQDTNTATVENANPPPIDTNPPPQLPPPVAPTNMAAIPPAVPVVPPPTPTVQPPTEPSAGTTYEVVAGDTLGKIAKAHGVSVKALEAANPGVDPKKLKVKQKLTIPAAATSMDTSASPGAVTGSTGGGSETYVVKSGDSLYKIAKKYGVSVKAIRAASNLTTDHIRVGQKLTIPAKAEAAAPVPTTTPQPDNGPAPVVPPASNPAPVVPAPTPAPGH